MDITIGLIGIGIMLICLMLGGPIAFVMGFVGYLQTARISQ